MHTASPDRLEWTRHHILLEESVVLNCGVAKENVNFQFKLMDEAPILLPSFQVLITSRAMYLSSSSHHHTIERLSHQKSIRRSQDARVAIVRALAAPAPWCVASKKLITHVEMPDQDLLL